MGVGGGREQHWALKENFMSKVQHQIKAPASQGDVDDKKAETVAGYIAAGV